MTWAARRFFTAQGKKVEKRSPARGKTYFCIVHAVNPGGRSAHSLRASATPVPPPPAAKPAPLANGGIPQNGGGDGDADNNGGPSDGDGNV